MPDENINETVTVGAGGAGGAPETDAKAEPTLDDLAGLFSRVREAERETRGDDPETERTDDKLDPVDEPDQIDDPDDGLPADESAELASDPDTDPATPTLQAPASMSAADAAAFAQAPADVQRWVLEREADQRASLTQKTQELADRRKQIEAQSAQLDDIIQRQKAALGPIVDQDIKPPDPKLRQEDPDAWEQEMAQYQYAKYQQEDARKRLDEAEGERKKLHEQQALDFLRERDADLVRRVPELADQQKGTKNVADLRSYVISRGILAEEHVNAATAPMAEAFWKAMLYDRAIAAGGKVAKKAAKPPKAQRPGAGKSPRSTAARDKQVAKALEDARKNPSKQSLAAAFGALRQG